MKSWRWVGIAAIATGVVLVAFLTYSAKNPSSSKCGSYRSDKTVKINSSETKVEVVSTGADRAQGLSGRPCIAADQGMLFIFDKPGRYPFWMKDMKFPIDIVWVGEDHKVVGLDINVAPSTYPDLFVPEKPAQYVLELQANRAKDLKIDLGNSVSF